MPLTCNEDGISGRSLWRESCLKICPNTSWSGNMIWCWHYMFWVLLSPNQVLTPCYYLFSYTFRCLHSAAFNAIMLLNMRLFIILLQNLFLEHSTGFWILIWRIFLSCTTKQNIISFWNTFSYWNCCFTERAGADVVECACLIGLPKFKVLSPHMTHI